MKYNDLDSKKVIHLVAAARPNFMKIAPLYHALRGEPWAEPVIVHTGQHYDLNMSEVFFKDLSMPEPTIHLGVGSGSHAEQTAHVMIEYEKVLLGRQPNLVVVVGDVNSTMAATLAAVKLGIKIGHLEAGLRSFDRTMPEEINRVITDTLADILWTPSPDADANLAKEGIPRNRIHRVGNIMIDSLEMLREKIERLATYGEFGLQPSEYGVVTLHRPSNVDCMGTLRAICESLVRVARRIPLIFPAHPRTRKNLERNGLMSFLRDTRQIVIIEPLSYLRFMNLIFNCRFAVTDSGGIQEETTYLGIPCLTLRPNTERPITITSGTNRLIRRGELVSEVEKAISSNLPTRRALEMWDGKTADRVVESIARELMRADWF